MPRRDVYRLKRELMEMPEGEPERMASLRRRVQRGVYRVESKELAKRIIKEALAEDLGRKGKLRRD